MIEKWLKQIKIWAQVLLSCIQMKNVKYFVNQLFSIGESYQGKCMVLFSSKLFLITEPMMDEHYLKALQM